MSSFDLLGEEVWQLLTEDVAADFPYLTLPDINAIMAMGRKGALDSGRAQPLNYTRIYKWVQARAVFSLGYWQNKHPALLAWAEMAGLTAPLLAELDTYETPAAAFVLPHKMRGLLQKVARKHYAPNVEYSSMTMYETLNKYPRQAEAMAWLEHQVHPAFLAQYPEEASQHTPLF